MSQKQWNNSADWYEQNMGEEGDHLNKDLIRPELLQLLGNLKGLKILDSGCGNGYVAAELAKQCEEVVGTDFSPNFVEICQRKYKGVSNLSFLEHNVEKEMPFLSNDFDAIVSKMVLQYVPSINCFATESFRVLKPDGELVVIVDHPFHTQFFYAQELVGKKQDKYPDLQDYFSNGERSKLSLWGKVELTWYQRKISDYVNSFTSVGFSLKTMSELAEVKDSTRLPRVLALAFVK